MMNQGVEWRRVLLDQLIFSITTVVVIMGTLGLQQAASAAVGAALSTANLALLAWTFSRLFAKKSFALAGAIIVTKYAILIGILYGILQQRWVQGMWLMAGIVTFLPTMLLLGWRAREMTGTED